MLGIKEEGVSPCREAIHHTVGDCFSNAMCESFFATRECEVLGRRHFKTQIEARLAVFDFIEGWYNPHRCHSALGYLRPVEFERRNQRLLAA